MVTVVKQTVELPVILNALKLVWHHSNAQSLVQESQSPMTRSPDLWSMMDMHDSSSTAAGVQMQKLKQA